MPVFAMALSLLSNCYPNLAFVVAVPEHAQELLAPYLNNSPFRAIITNSEEDKKNAMAASNFAFVKSGTVAFEVALAGVPMLVTYKMNAVSVWLLKRVIITKYVNLINILLNKETIPELLQEHCAPMMLASCANSLLSNPDLQQNQQESVKTALGRLVPPGDEKPSDIAAKKILSLLS
jgi:lipid-A-disaccharide synthase